MTRRQVLLLNMNYTPIDICSWRKAVNLVIGRNKAHILSEYKDKLNPEFNAAVIRLVVKIPNLFKTWERQRFSKRKIFLRDRFTCQYCNKRLHGTELTIDHVIPRSKGGKTHYTNCVTCCRDCNVFKDNLTLEEAGMRLLNPIRRPMLYDSFNEGFTPEEWEEYLWF